MGVALAGVGLAGAVLVVAALPAGDRWARGAVQLGLSRIVAGQSQAAVGAVLEGGPAAASGFVAFDVAGFGVAASGAVAGGDLRSFGSVCFAVHYSAALGLGASLDAGLVGGPLSADHSQGHGEIENLVSDLAGAAFGDAAFECLGVDPAAAVGFVARSTIGFASPLALPRGGRAVCERRFGLRSSAAPLRERHGVWAWVALFLAALQLLGSYFRRALYCCAPE